MINEFFKTRIKSVIEGEFLQRSSNDFIIGKKFKFDTFCLNRSANNNVAIVGMSGKGKTSCLVETNLLQRNAAFVVADAKGQIVNKIGGLLSLPGCTDFGPTAADVGYDIRVLNLKDPACSFHYNPFKYIRNENDCIVLGKIVAEHDCEGRSSRSSDLFWTMASSNLITGIIYFLWKYRPVEEQCFSNVLKILQSAKSLCESSLLKKVEQDDFHRFFDNLSEKDSFLGTYLGTYLKAPSDTTGACILAEALAPLAPFSEPSVAEMMCCDELNLYDFADFKAGEDKVPALFVICDDLHANKNFISCMVYKQLFEILCESADLKHGGSLPYPVRFFLDDFATIGEVPDFSNLISNVRSRNISIVMMIQNENQLTSVYGKNAENIIENCNHYVYLGGNSLDQHKKMKERFGVRKFYRNREKGLFLIDNTKRTYNVYPLHYKEHKNYREVEFDFEKYISERSSCTSNAVSEINIEELYCKSLIENEKVNVCRRMSWEDSYSELALYYHMIVILKDCTLKDYLGRNLILVPHVHLNELTDMEKIEVEYLKKRLSMMHVDLMVFTKDYNPIIAFECDGEYHRTKGKQKERDSFKEYVFRELNIPLFRIEDTNARQTSLSVATVSHIIDEIKKQLQIIEKKECSSIPSDDDDYNSSCEFL